MSPLIGRRPARTATAAAKYAIEQQGVCADEFTNKLWQKLRTDKEQMVKQLTLDIYEMVG